jgi:hypothetical protein
LEILATINRIISMVNLNKNKDTQWLMFMFQEKM